MQTLPYLPLTADIPDVELEAVGLDGLDVEALGWRDCGDVLASKKQDICTYTTQNNTNTHTPTHTHIYICVCVCTLSFPHEKFWIYPRPLMK